MKTKTEPAMTDETKLVFCVASSRLHANRIVDHLANAGFARDGISVVLPNTAIADDVQSTPARRVCSTAHIGLAIGGAIGWLVGWGALSVPGSGHLLAAGPLGAVLTGSSTGTAAARGIKSALVNLGLRRSSAGVLQQQVKEGQILVSLEAHNWQEADAARKIFVAMGAANVTIGGTRASDLMIRAFSDGTTATQMTVQAG